MKRAFTTVQGKVEVENGRIYIWRLKESGSGEHYQYMFWMVFAFSIVLRDKPTKLLAYIIIAITSVILLGFIVQFFYMNKWKNTFNINRIKTFKVESDRYGLETTVTIYFKSNTGKAIAFRTSENQHQGFVQLIEEHLTSPQIA